MANELRIVVLEDRRMSDFGLFSTAAKNPPSNCPLVLPPVVDGKRLAPLYLFGCFHRRAMSRAIDDLGIGWASIAKGVHVQVWSSKYVSSVTNKGTIFTSRVLNETSFYERPLFTFHRMITIIS